MNARRRMAAGAAALALVMTVASASFAATQIDWSTPVTVSGSGSDGWWPRATASDSGSRLTAVWRKQNLGGTFVETASSTDAGATWSTPQQLDGMDGEAAVVSSQDGLLVTAIWHSAGLDHLRTARSTDGGQTWSTPQNIVSPVNSLTSNPRLAASADGTRLVATWVTFVSGKAIAQAAFSTDAGVTWSAPDDLSESSENAVDPAVGSSSDGSKVVVAFSQSVGVTQKAFVRTSSDGGDTWGTAEPISTGTNGTSPQVALSADGMHAHVVFEDNAGSNSQVQATSSDDGGANWSDPVPVSDSTQDADRVQVLGSADGTRLMAAWERSDGSNARIQTSASADSGATWSDPETHSPAGSDAEYAQIAGSDDASRATIAWV